jgi:hypothetical protein
MVTRPAQLALGNELQLLSDLARFGVYFLFAGASVKFICPGKACS